MLLCWGFADGSPYRCSARCVYCRRADGREACHRAGATSFAFSVDAVALATELAAGAALGPRRSTGTSGGTVAEFAVRMRAGMPKAMPLGGLGASG